MVSLQWSAARVLVQNTGQANEGRNSGSCFQTITTTNLHITIAAHTTLLVTRTQIYLSTPTSLWPSQNLLKLSHFCSFSPLAISQLPQPHPSPNRNRIHRRPTKSTTPTPARVAMRLGDPSRRARRTRAPCSVEWVYSMSSQVRQSSLRQRLYPSPNTNLFSQETQETEATPSREPLHRAQVVSQPPLPTEPPQSVAGTALQPIALAVVEPTIPSETPSAGLEAPQMGGASLATARSLEYSPVRLCQYHQFFGIGRLSYRFAASQVMLAMEATRAADLAGLFHCFSVALVVVVGRAEREGSLRSTWTD